MVWNFIIQIVVALVLNVIAYLLTPKPPKSKADEARELEYPTAEAGRPIRLYRGTIWCQSPNVLGYWDKARRNYKVS